MNSNIFVLDNGASYLLLDINSLRTCSIDKRDFTRENLQRTVSEQFSDQRPYFERLKPQNEQPEKLTPTIVTSYACNYACEYCYQRPSKSIYDRMKPEDIDAIYRFYQVFCERYNFPFEFEAFSIMGGEPLLPENRGVLEKIVQVWPDCTLTFTTNGSYLLDYEDYLLSCKSNVRVSLDGTEKTHYSRRKTADLAAYGRAIEGISHLIEKGKKITVLTVFSPDHLDDYSQFFDQLESLGWKQDASSKIELAFLPEIGNGSDDRKLEKVMKDLEAYAALRTRDPRAGAVNVIKLVPGANPLFTALEQASKGFYEPYRCGILTNPSFAFLPDGSIMPCLAVQDKQFSVGRFKPKFEVNEDLIAALAKRRIDEMERCRDCSKRALCGGGCVATVLAKKKDVAAVCCDLWDNLEYLNYLEWVMR